MKEVMTVKAEQLVAEYKQLRAEGVGCDDDLASDFLLTLLWDKIGGQDTPAAEIRRLTRAIGFRWGTIRRLKDELDIKSYRRGGQWWWHYEPLEDV